MMRSSGSFRGQVKAVIQSRRGEACFSARGVGEFGGDLVGAVYLVVVVAHDGVGAVGKTLAGVHVFELRLEARVVGTVMVL